MYDESHTLCSVVYYTNLMTCNQMIEFSHLRRYINCFLCCLQSIPIKFPTFPLNHILGRTYNFLMPSSYSKSSHFNIEYKVNLCPLSLPAGFMTQNLKTKGGMWLPLDYPPLPSTCLRILLLWCWVMENELLQRVKISLPKGPLLVVSSQEKLIGFLKNSGILCLQQSSPILGV